MSGKPTRGDFLRSALEQMGKPYLWGAKGPDAFDCSGLVTFTLWRLGGPNWRKTHNTDRLLNELPETTEPKPGDLCLYGVGNRDASHVMIWLGVESTVFGASGGNSSTTSLKLAADKGACVKTKSTWLYRPDFIGFRSLSPHLKET